MATKSKKAYFIRLLNGDDLIAEVVKNTKTGLVVKNPMMIISSIEMEKGKQTLIMFPWIPQGIAVGNVANIRAENIILFNEIEPEIKDYYEGMCLDAFVPKQTVVTSDATKASELQSNFGKNVISFGSRKQLLQESLNESK